MSETVPWKLYHTTPEGVIDIRRKPRVPLRYRLGAAACAAFLSPFVGIQADVIYSSISTVQSQPDTTLAKDSIPCDNADAVIFVDPGFGIQNSYLTAEKIVPLANAHNMCTRYVTYGTTADVNVLADKKAEVLRSSRRLQRAADANLKPNSIDIGESLGGIIAARTRNAMVAKYGDEFNYPALINDSTPSGGEAVRWGNPTVAETVARNCQYVKVGDFVMTLVTVLTDPDADRRAELFDLQTGPAFFWRVYNATKDASMQLRLHESCEVGRGYPDIDQSKVQTTVIDMYADGDPIVDGSISKDIIRQRANDDFIEVHMSGPGVDGNHASAWFEWPAYEQYYRDAIQDVANMIQQHETNWWYRKAPGVPQPR